MKSEKHIRVIGSNVTACCFDTMSEHGHNIVTRGIRMSEQLLCRSIEFNVLE